MKRVDLRLSHFGDSRRLERDRVRSGRDLIRVTKLTRGKLDELRDAVRHTGGYDELLYLLAGAALADLKLEQVNLELEQQVNPADPPGIPRRRPRVGKPRDRQVNPAPGGRKRRR